MHLVDTYCKIGWRKKININNKTKLYLSCSGSPGNFGATLYNFFFKKLSINSVYIPRYCIDPKSLSQSIRDLDCAGCSVSMPLKTGIMPFLDRIEDKAKIAQSVNTVKNMEGLLEGYNTDIYGILQVLKGTSFKNVTIYGSGSVVGSLITALRSMGVEKIIVVSRNMVRVQEIKTRFNVLDHSSSESIDLLINATPVGYAGDFAKLMLRSKSVFDLVVSQRETPIISEAIKEGKEQFSGLQMALHQFRQQFLIYTNIELGIKDIQKAVKQHYQA